MRKRRLDLKLFQKEVAGRLVVDETTIHNWETNRTSPALSYIPKIIKFIGYVPFECPEDVLGRLVYFKRINGLSLQKLGSLMGRDPEQLMDWLSGKVKPCWRNLESINMFLAKQGL